MSDNCQETGSEKVKSASEVNKETLDFVYKEITRANDGQWDQAESIDSKAGSLLGFVGVILTIIAAGYFRIWNQNLPEPIIYLFFSALFFVVLSALLSILVLQIRKYRIGNKPNTLLHRYLEEKESKVYTKVKMTANHSSDYDFNKEKISSKALCFKYSLWSLAIGFGILTGTISFLLYI